MDSLHSRIKEAQNFNTMNEVSQFASVLMDVIKKQDASIGKLVAVAELMHFRCKIMADVIEGLENQVAALQGKAK